jgi:hypothetical protein
MDRWARRQTQVLGEPLQRAFIVGMERTVICLHISGISALLLTLPSAEPGPRVPGRAPGALFQQVTVPVRIMLRMSLLNLSMLFGLSDQLRLLHEFGLGEMEGK